MKTSILKRISGAVICIALLTGLASCSKKNDSPTPPPANQGKTAKFTVTVSGLSASSFVSFTFIGSTADLNNSTTWKLNGTVQNNQRGISLGNNDFSGSVKTYVIESAAPLQNITAEAQCLSPDNKPFTISFKSEINGEVKESDQNVTVTKAADFTHNFSY